ncbi:4962_t:CDS:2 [Acaulospora morrowiae]|uniref:4962_t:CDS:1 n=1 Tax=Acaulospora morrowiae TaxID=94023 RepID=A0A9N9F4T4_9GLOM|nr:4962_t:CDS:2 [Acaulospora morrowiae]
MDMSNTEKPIEKKGHSDDRIILNIGGVKYETYRSTLTAHQDTLLGTMFQERNQNLLHPTNENEYFFDRDGIIFRYIMQFYRTGEIFWPEDTNYITDSTQNLHISRRELELEFDFFQIPVPGRGEIDKTGAVSLVDGFLNALDSVANHVIKKYNATIRVQFRLGMLEYEVDEDIESLAKEILDPFKLVGYKILSKFSKEIASYLMKNHSCLNSKVVRKPNKGYYEIRMMVKEFDEFDEQTVFKYSKLANVVESAKVMYDDEED